MQPETIRLSPPEESRRPLFGGGGDSFGKVDGLAKSFAITLTLPPA